MELCGYTFDLLTASRTRCYDQDTFEFWTKEEALEKARKGEVLVATTFIIPYPPGFPILVPGQVCISAAFGCMAIYFQSPHIELSS